MAASERILGFLGDAFSVWRRPTVPSAGLVGEHSATEESGPSGR